MLTANEREPVRRKTPVHLNDRDILWFQVQNSIREIGRRVKSKPENVILGTSIGAGAAAIYLEAAAVPSEAQAALEDSLLIPYPDHYQIAATPAVKKDTTGVVGGRGFGITLEDQNRTSTSWDGGTIQKGYQLLTYGSSSGVKIIPQSGMLPDISTSYMDSSAQLDALKFFILLPVDAAGNQLGNSDGLFTIRGIASPSNAAQRLTTRLNENNTASITWNNPVSGPPERRFLLPIHFNGTSSLPLELSGNTTSASFDTKGLMTCFLLYDLRGTTETHTDLACGIPGLSNFPDNQPSQSPTSTRTATATATKPATASATPSPTKTPDKSPTPTSTPNTWSPWPEAALWQLARLLEPAGIHLVRATQPPPNEPDCNPACYRQPQKEVYFIGIPGVVEGGIMAHELCHGTQDYQTTVAAGLQWITHPVSTWEQQTQQGQEFVQTLNAFKADLQSKGQPLSAWATRSNFEAFADMCGDWYFRQGQLVDTTNHPILVAYAQKWLPTTPLN